MKTSIYIAQEKSSYKSEEIGKNFAVFGRMIPIEESLDHIMSTNRQDLKDVYNKIFVTKPTLSIIGPKPSVIDYQKLSDQLKS